MSILTLSTLWKFESVRVTSIDALASYADQDPVLKICAALKYDVPGWLVPGVNALAQRDEALTSLDVARFKLIGDADVVMDLVLKIARVRESFVPCLVQSLGSLTIDSSVPPHCSHSQSSTACSGVCNRRQRDFTACICAAFNCDPDGRSKAEAEEERQGMSRGYEEEAAVERERCEMQEAEYLREEAEAATELQRQTEAKAEDRLTLAKAARQAEGRNAKVDAEVLRMEEARETARAAAEAEAEAERHRLALEASKRLAEAEFARAEVEAEAAEGQRFEVARLKAEQEEADRLRLAEEQRQADEAAATAAAEAARLKAVEEEAERQRVAAEEEQRRVEEERAKVDSFLSVAEAPDLTVATHPLSTEYSTSFWGGLALLTRPPVPRSLPGIVRAISAEDQAKLDAIAAELQAAEAEVEQVTAAAKKLKDVADAEEATAAKLEAESAGNAVKKVRATTARRKAVASAKAAAPGLKATEEATAKRDAIQARLDALLLSLVPSSPSTTTGLLAAVGPARPHVTT
jgi:hypothetical protein